MIDGIILGTCALIISGAVFYIIRAKKKGQRCIGCPYGKGCGGHCEGK